MSMLDDVLKIMRTKDTCYKTTAWDTFKATLDLCLNAVKLEPVRAGETIPVLRALLKRVYNEDFIHGPLTYQTIQAFLIPKRGRFIQLLPRGQAGAEIMQLIVTALTMAGGGAQDNQWATNIVIAVNHQPAQAAPPGDVTLVDRLIGG